MPPPVTPECSKPPRFHGTRIRRGVWRSSRFTLRGVRIRAAGGTIHVEEQEVPGMGACCLCTDPAGRMRRQWKAVRGT
jgi:hypothetical protein